MESKPTLLYYFTHQYLRKLILEHPSFVNSVIRQGPQVFENVLKLTFEELKAFDLSEKELALQQGDFSTSLAKLNNNTIPLLVIKLPEPKNTTEASYIGITLSLKPRYFTLELHIPEEVEKQLNPQVQTKHILCEWNENGHRSHNERWEIADAAKFSGGIERILTSSLTD